jgi:TLC domain
MHLLCPGAGFLLWELSTPLVHARWFMLKAGQSRSTAYTVNGIALVLVFFACRPVWGTWLSLRVSGCCRVGGAA